MEQERVNQILMMISPKLPSASIPSIRERMLNSDISESDLMMFVNELKDPTIAIILSILVGTLGVDRFYIGDTGLGIGKLLTGGGCGI